MKRKSGLRALAVKPAGTCRLSLVLEALDPSPEARAESQGNLIGIIVGPEPWRAAAQGVHYLDSDTWLSFEQRRAQRLRRPLMRGAVGQRQDKDFHGIDDTISFRTWRGCRNCLISG